MDAKKSEGFSTANWAFADLYPERRGREVSVSTLKLNFIKRNYNKLKLPCKEIQK
jgi:hypothetical protein